MAWRAVLIVVGLVFVLSAPVQAQQGDDANALNAHATKLYGEGKYEEAIPLAKHALAIEEKALGPDHPDVGASLGALAAMYQDQGTDVRKLMLDLVVIQNRVLRTIFSKRARRPGMSH